MEFLDLNYYFSEVPENLRWYFDEARTTYRAINGLRGYFESRGVTENLIGENAKIHESAIIETPVIIGDGVEIGPGAYIRPFSIICDGAKIGHVAQIKEAIILPGAKVQNHSFVGNSIIGNKARIGSGTITANRRFDQKDIGIKIGEEYHGLERDYFGVILGDKSRLGASVVTLPGAHIGPMTLVMPLTRVKGFVERVKMVDGETISDGKEYDLK
jgi:N-acetylglucosamine-1-phosphate uridyltransferase (contains nucleotidyltransferase and I-patch acetyltransferase domains)